MTIKEISIAQLREGMYICELDLPWIKNPFFRSKLLVKNSSEINQLKSAGCKTLKIDTSQGADIADTPDTPASGSTPNQATPEPIDTESAATAITAEKNVATKPVEASKGSPKPAETPQLIKRPQTPSASIEDFNSKQKAALVIRNQTISAINEINSQIVRGNPIKQEQLLPLVDTMIAELNENEQAMLASLNIQSNQGLLNAHLYNTMTLVLSAAPSITDDIKEMMLLGQAALLHDIGWTKLPGYMIQKGRPFTPQEKKLEKQHVDLSLAKLKAFPDIPERVLALVAAHHEMPNGKGYPRGLKDNSLDKGCRLLSIAIRYDELTHALFDNIGMLPAKAMKQLFKEALAGNFDQKLVSAFIHLLGVYPIGSAVKLSDNSKGVIVHHQPDSPLKPQILKYYDSDGKVLTAPRLLDTKVIEGLEISGFVDSNNPQDDPAGLLRVNSEA